MALTIQLPPLKQQTALNLERWKELLADPELAKIEGRIETDRYGHIIMSPPPAPSHGDRQSQIVIHLAALLPRGKVITECPISTSDGVKASDVAWLKPARARESRGSVCLTTAPEICVEVFSPSNTRPEMEEKRALYFEAGAREVWFCLLSGVMEFYASDSDRSLKRSALCPKFPAQIE